MKSATQNIILLILLVLALIPFLWIAFYCHPSADDFAYAWSGREVGVIASCKRDYLNWNGRYFSNILMFSNPIRFGLFTFYQTIPVILVVLTFISLWMFIREVFLNLISCTQIAAFSLLLTLLFLLQMPQLAQGIFWYTGAVSYQGASIIMMFYCTHLLQVYRKKFVLNKGFHLVLMGIEIICIVGFNETAMIQLLFLHLLTVVYFREKWFWGLSSILLICSVFVIFSPGNAGRAANFQNAHQLFYSLEYACLQTVRFFLVWISFIPLLIASLLFLPLAKKLKCQDLFFLNKIRLNSYFAFVVLLIVIFISVFPAYWSTGMLGQHRTLNSACFFFILIWFLNLYVWVKNYTSNQLLNKMIETFTKYNYILFLAFFCSLFLRGNLLTVSTDLADGKAKRYDVEMKNRYSKIESCIHVRERQCNLDSLKIKPLSIFSFELAEDKNYWINKGEAAYFKLDAIQINN